MNRQETLTRFEKSLNIRRLADRTKKIYIQWINIFFDYIGFEDSNFITLFQGQDFLEYLIETKNYAPRTHNQAVYALHQLYEGVLGMNITKRSLPILRVPQTNKPFFTTEQACELIEKCPDPRLRAAIVLGCGCGLRISEITKLKYKDIYRNGKYLTIHESKGKKTRFVHYNATVARYVNQYCEQIPAFKRKPDDYVFPSKNPDVHLGNTVLTQQFSEYIRAFPFSLPNHTFHSLRHTYATSLAMKNVPLPEIQKAMGHTLAATTATYIHCPEQQNFELPDPLEVERRVSDDQ